MSKNVEFFNWKLDPANPVTAERVCYDKRMGFRSPDIHSAIHLGVVLRGEICCRFGRTELNFLPGSIYLTSPWEPHNSSVSPGTELLLITLDSRSLEDFFCSCRENLAALIHLPPGERMALVNRSCRGVESVGKLIPSGKIQPSPREKLRLWHSVLAFFLEIIPEQVSHIPEDHDYSRLLPLLERLGSKLITLPEAARICSLSVSRFSALFKNFSGLSFSRYERNFRLNGALGSIRRGATLKEAAEMWDFCDKSHLARLLKNF